MHHGKGGQTALVGTASVWRRPRATVWLLVALLLLIVSSPFLEAMRNGPVIGEILIAGVLLLALIAIGGRKRSIAIAVALLLPALIGRYIDSYRPRAVSIWVVGGAAIIFAAFVVVRLLDFVIRARSVDAPVLCAGASAYLILGLLWTLVYVLVGQVSHGAFAYNGVLMNVGELKGLAALYFSFATLSTVGYGDIAPVTSTARIASVLEAVTGTFFMAVVIARLVAMHTPTVPAA